MPKFLSFAKDVGGAFYLSYGGEVVDLGVEADVDMVLGLADRKPKLVTLQLGVELGGSGGVGLRTTGSVKGTWHDAMGMIGLDLEEATFKFGIDADTAVEIGMKAKEVIEGDRSRVQMYEGVCIARSNKGVNSNFTVRKISFGEGVERVFPLYSPIVDSIEVVRRGAVRRAKLYYLRGRRGKSARIAERRDTRPAKGTESSEG